MTDSITFRPTEEQGAFIETLVKSGDYASQCEVIRAGIRLLHEQTAASELAHLRQLIKEGEDSPIISDWNADDFLTRMKKKHNA